LREEGFVKYCKAKKKEKKRKRGEKFESLHHSYLSFRSLVN
jgi:hypothetical protein